MSPEPQWPWSVLGLTGKSPEADIRRAYAAKLKAIDQSAEADKFQTLRQAYDFALHVARATKSPNRPVAPPPVLVQPAPAPVHQHTPVPLVIEIAPERPTEPDEPPEPTKWDRLKTLKSELRDANPWTTTGHTVTTLLNHPLAQDDDVGPVIRRAIRDEIIEGIAKNHGEWPASLGKAEVAALDRAYHWLSDFRAAEMDFGARGDLLHMMASVFADTLENAEANAAAARQARAGQRGSVVVPVLSFIGAWFVGYQIVFGVAGLMGATIEGNERRVTGFLLLLCSIVFMKVFSQRLRPIYARTTQPLADALDGIRKRNQRFALSSGRRSLVTLVWILTFIIVSGNLSQFELTFLRWIPLTLIALGVTHEVIQVWLNSGKG